MPLRSLSADVPEVGVLERELAWLKEHLPQLDSPVVFCHNDLLCKNIIYDSSKGTVSRPGAAGLRQPHQQLRGVPPQAGAGQAKGDRLL